MSNPDNNSELMMLIADNDINEALALIATGKSNPGWQNAYGNTALHYACHYDHTDVALALIATGESNPGCQNMYGNTALHLVVYGVGNIALIKALLATGESNPRCQNITGADVYNILSYSHENEVYSEIVAILNDYMQIN